jgi:hypothetical protein
MDFTDLIRWAISLTALVCVVALLAAVRKTGQRTFARALLLWAVPVGAAALLLSHAPMPAGLGPRLLPLGLLFGLAAGLGSLGWRAARDAFDAMPDATWRHLTAFRGVFGALLLAAGATGQVLPVFGLEAGLGDLTTAWLASASPRPLSAGGSKGWRLLVHGVGLVDFFNVFVLLATVVRPWLLQQPGLGVSLLLPWLAVPVLLTVNLHGLRRTLEELRSRAAAGPQPGLDGPEPAGGLRGPVA